MLEGVNQVIAVTSLISAANPRDISTHHRREDDDYSAAADGCVHNTYMYVLQYDNVW